MFQALQAVGHTVDAVAPDKAAANGIPTAIDDSEGHNDANLLPLHAQRQLRRGEARELRQRRRRSPVGVARKYLRMHASVMATVKHFTSTGNRWPPSATAP